MTGNLAGVLETIAAEIEPLPLLSPALSSPKGRRGSLGGTAHTSTLWAADGYMGTRDSVPPPPSGPSGPDGATAPRA